MFLRHLDPAALPLFDAIIGDAFSPQLTRKYLDFEPRIVKSAVGGPPSVEEAVAIIRSSPMVAEIACDPDMWRAICSIGEANRREINALMNPETRELADLSRLIELAVEDQAAFDCLDELTRWDMRKPGIPNKHLREWVASRSSAKRPKKTDRTPATHAIRDTFVTLAMADAITLGFPAYMNAKRKPGSASPSSAAQVVKDALPELKLPGVAAIEKIWTANKDRIAWLQATSES